jgi:hypothetical protein
MLFPKFQAVPKNILCNSCNKTFKTGNDLYIHLNKYPHHLPIKEIFYKNRFKKVYFFHMDMVKKHLIEISETGETIIFSTFLVFLFGELCKNQNPCNMSIMNSNYSLGYTSKRVDHNKLNYPFYIISMPVF